jgi:hypothetical protein
LVSVDWKVLRTPATAYAQALAVFADYGNFKSQQIRAVCLDEMLLKHLQTKEQAYFLIKDTIEDSSWLSELVRISLVKLPALKPKKKN